MNGPVKIYRTQQIVRHDLPIELPTCMYKLKSIYAERNGTSTQTSEHVSPPKKLDIFEQNNSGNAGMAEFLSLQTRQEKVLKQLEDLKKTMLAIKADLKGNQATGTQKTQKAKASKIQEEFVINASPEFPPYSLQILQKLLQDEISLKVKSYLHSSVPSLPPKVADFVGHLEQFKPRKNVPEVNVRLIWKNVGPDTELVLNQFPIKGEVNIFRYLSRTSQNSFNYENLPNLDEIDSLLDLSYRLVSSKTKTERASLLQNATKTIVKGSWLAGQQKATVADVALFSAVKQVASNEVSATLSKWMQKCEQL